MNVRFHCYSLFILLIIGCQTGREKTENHFTGPAEAVQMAHTLFDTLGGLDAWEKTKALYIKAEHVEEDLQYPYTSEIWRDLDSFKMRIEQKSPEFHRIGYFSEEGAWIIYQDLDSTRQLSAESQSAWRKENNRNIYVMLKRVASTPGYRVETNNERLEFMADSIFLFAVKLDSDFRPHHYITRNSEGKEEVTVFTAWERHPHQKQLHPVAGGPLNGEFTYRTQIWQPHRMNYDRAFSIPSAPQ